MNTDSGKIRLRIFAQPTTFLGAGLLVFIYGALAYLLISDAREAVRLATVRAENLVRVYEGNLSTILNKIDGGLEFVQIAFQHDREAFDINALPSSVFSADSDLVAYALTDAEGRVIAASPRSLPVDEISSIPSLIAAHQSNAGKPRHVSTPFHLTPAGKSKFAITRPFYGPDNAISGLALAIIDIEELSRSLEGVDLGPKGALGLTGTDRVVRMRIADGKLDRGSIGRKLPPMKDASNGVVEGEARAFWNKPANFDDVSRLVSFQLVEPYPLMVIAGIAEDEVYRHARHNAFKYSLLVAIVTFVTILVVLIAARRKSKLIAAIAEMTQAQSALRRSEERYRKVEAAVIEGIWDWNIETGEDYLSPRWKAILGYDEHELENLRETFLQLIHPDDREPVAAAAQAHLDNDTPYDVEFRLRRKNGEYLWVQSRGKAERDDKGRTTRMVGIMTDVSDRKRAEAAIAEEVRRREEAQAALARTEERYRKVETAVHDGIWDTNLETGDCYLSPQWKTILGFEDHELPSCRKSFYERIHADDEARVLAVVAAHLERGEPYEFEARLRHKDGGYVWVRSRGNAERDANGRPVRILGTIVDISERKRAEQELKEEVRRREDAQAALEQSEERYRKVEAAVNDGIWDRDFLTGEYYLSPRWKDILGFAEDELPSDARAFYGRIHPDDEAHVVAAVQAHLDGGEPYSVDVRLRHKDGSYVWVRSCGKAERDAKGRAVRMLGTIRDISDRKRVEEKLKEAVRRREEAQAELARINRDLEDRVAQRTVELAREMRSREEAQMLLAQVRKLEAVGQLTAGIAHDFNNLLSVIYGGLEFVSDAARRALPADPEIIETSMRAARRGGEMVQRLLAFVRQAPLQAEPAQADQLVLDALRLLQRTLGEKIEIETRFDAAAFVRVDRNQMVNVLVNLALNARDAMPESGVLTITTECRPSPWAATEGAQRWPTGEAVCITVSDTGTGMTEEVRRRAGEPFFTTKPDGLGSGLGLSTVLDFVEQTGGHLDISSVVGQGTSITIYLPRVHRELAVVGAAAGTHVVPAGCGKLVLLVEDDPDMKAITAAQLKKLGYQVHLAANGDEAISIIESPTSIALMLTDIVLPGRIDGVTLVKEALRTRPGMRVLCMTGYDPGRSNRKWLDIQNICLLEKPFTSAQLAAALSDTLLERAS